MSATSLRVAAVQFQAQANEVTGNLARAETLIESAVAQGAQLVLLPELTPGGYQFTPALWDSAETHKGRSVSWLRALAKRHAIYLGMSYLEAEGEHFYNSFVLADPAGEIAGRVRKNPPASAEAYFFAAGADAHCIDTKIGRIGVSICYEAMLYDYLAEHQRKRIDLLLIPMSAATPTADFPLRKKDCASLGEMVAGMAAHHARALGVPVVLANKCGPLVSDMPGLLPRQETSFPGKSTIADGRGEVVGQLGGDEAVVVGDVNLDAACKVGVVPRRYGRWALPSPCYAFMFPAVAYFGARHYARNAERARRARAVSDAQ